MEPRRLTKAQIAGLQRQLRATSSKNVSRRTLCVLRYGAGESATAIARQLTLHRTQVHRWWRLYAQAHDPSALLDDPRPGRPNLWTSDHARRLEALLERSPQQLGLGAVEWTVPLLQAQLEGQCAWRASSGTVRQALHDLGYVWKRSRYELEPDPQEEKKTPKHPKNSAFAGPLRSAGPG